MVFSHLDKKKGNYWKIIAVFAIPFVAGIVWLIIIYNNVVTMEHEIDGMKTGIQKIQTESADMGEQIFSFLDGSNLESFMRERNLIKDKSPDYFKISQR